ncbi:SAM-dependent methyltransferase [Streptomyces rubiginosohelvolus]|uniref:SAM-dependent methyltransferase n=1 Tax=Streptomyces rubiginosohelvolus TaxID=67362 RepID=UPI0038072091
MAHGEKPQSRRPIDTNTPSVARMYDYLLGGSQHYEVDRKASADLLRIAPSTQQLARSNRDFLRRVVRVLARDMKIRQFLDHGSGLPTLDNVHEVVQRIRPDTKVAYIDNDPMVLAHGRTQLHDNDNVMVIDQDMRETTKIRAATDPFLDWTKPIAALFVSVLHCLPDTDDERDPAALIKRVAAELPAGSYVVICQLVSDDAAVRDNVTRLMAEATHNRWGRVRERHEVRQYFDGMEIINPPGLVDVIDWQPDHPAPPKHLRPTDWVEWGGVARIEA